MKNPFNLTFGDVPQLFIDNGKSEKLVELIQNSEFARLFFITGVRGSGKTSFMSKVMKDVSNDKNCYAINLINDDKLTFLLRSEKIYLSELSSAKILGEYKKVFHGESNVMNKMTQAVDGYSYAFQLLGYLLFDKCQGKVPTIGDLNDVLADFKNRLFENAYQKIFLSLSDMDREFLLYMRKDSEFGEIVKQMDKSKVYVAQYRKRLIDRCLISPQTRGKLKFNLPFFKEYLKMVQDPDSIFYLGL